MGEIKQLYEEGFLAECPNCGGDRWFIRMDDFQDLDKEYESDLEWILSIISVTCVECGEVFDIVHNGIVFEPDFKGDEDGDS